MINEGDEGQPLGAGTCCFREIHSETPLCPWRAKGPTAVNTITVLKCASCNKTPLSSDKQSTSENGVATFVHRFLAARMPAEPD